MFEQLNHGSFQKGAICAAGVSLGNAGDRAGPLWDFSETFLSLRLGRGRFVYAFFF